MLNITVARKSKAPQFEKNLKKIGKLAAYVGIPEAASKARDSQLLVLAGRITGTGKKSIAKKTKLEKAAAEDVTNAQLLFIHTKGSPKMGIPPRPVIEPAIQADGNRQAIAHEIAEASKAVLDDKPGEAQKRMKRAGMAGQNASRDWFTDGRNGWAPNSTKPLGEFLARKLTEKYGRLITPEMSYVDAKGSDQPLIDTGALRASITYLVKDDE